MERIRISDSHTAIENRWVFLKYLVIWLSDIIPQ